MDILLAVFFFILGSVLASFYGVMATRLPVGKSIVAPRSHCDHCNHQLKWWELVPILSYLFLGGKCHHCKEKIPITGFIVEVVMGLSFMASYLYFKISYEFFISLFLISLFILIYWTDITHMIILDSPLVVTLVATFFLQGYYFGYKEAFFSLLSGLFMFFLMLIIGLLGKWLFKRDALGGGDIKLVFLFGQILGIPHALIALVLSTFLALPYATFSLFHTNQREVPYGPFLISSLCLVFFFYDKFSYIVALF